MLKNEKKSFQIALDITDSEFINMDIASSLNDCLNISVVKNVPSDLAAPKRTDNFYIKKVPGLYLSLIHIYLHTHFTTDAFIFVYLKRRIVFNIF